MESKSPAGLERSGCVESRGLPVRPLDSLHCETGKVVRISANPEEFRYEEALSGDCIRLLLIEAGSGNHEIRCRLTVESLYKQHTYMALSYVWGDASARQDIICNGASLSITKNLYELLWRLREDGQTHQPVWADAVCISQANTTEKTEQIRVMRTIYEQASLVLAWLGNPEEEEENKMGFEVLKSIYSRFGSSVTIEDLSQPHFDNVADLGLPVPVGGERSAEWKALVSILYRPYFFRAWIVQEILVGRRCIVQCGTQQVAREAILSIGILWEKFPYIKDMIVRHCPVVMEDGYDGQEPSFYIDEFAKAFRGEGAIETEETPVLPTLRELWVLAEILRRNNGQGLPIMQLLISTRSFQATVPHDKIFALVSLSHDTPPGFIDYEKPIAQVQVELAQRCMQMRPTWGPRLFSHIDMRHHSEDTPSWVPDWASGGIAQVDLGTSYYKQDAADNFVSNWEFPSPGCLSIPGIVFDEVASTIEQHPYMIASTKLRNFTNMIQHMHEMEEWDDACWALVQSRHQYFTGESPYEVYWRTLVFNRDKFQKEPTNEFGRLYAIWMSMYITFNQLTEQVRQLGTLKTQLEQASASWEKSTIFGKLWRFWSVFAHRWAFSKALLLVKLKLETVQKLDREAKPFDEAFKAYSMGRKMFSTSAGFIGWAPFDARIGDKMCVFRNYKLPFIIRRCGNEYRLVGDCYLHGLMDMSDEEWETIGRTEDILLI